MNSHVSVAVYVIALLVVLFLTSVVMSNDPSPAVRKHEEVEMAKKGTSTFWVVGKSYLIRTVTMYQTGELVAIEGPNDSELVLKNAAWVACTEKFSDTLRTGELAEVEPYPDDEPVLVNRSAVIDAVAWKHELPRKQK